MTADMTERDPIQTEVIGSALASICDEMGETLVRASHSPNVKERRDCTTALFTREGYTLAQAEHIPIHLGSLMGVIQAVLARYPLEDIHEGDGFIGNDPYTGGGTHLPDIVVVEPIFVDGVLRAWATNLAHHSDFANRSHAHIFQEGLRIPVIRHRVGGEYVGDIMHLILTNMQVPSERVSDFHAQDAANRVGVERYRELCTRYGADVVVRSSDDLLDSTEIYVRSGIRRIPNGHYSFRDVFDENRIEGRVLELGVDVEVFDQHIRFDFDAPAQVDAGLNAVRTALLATVYYAVKTIVGPEIPANAGLYRAIEVNAPEGSILNCTVPAAVASRTMVCQRVVDLVYGALAQAVPEQVTAAATGQIASTLFSGIDPRTGKYFVYLEAIGGGTGASAALDGFDGVQTHISNTSNLPIESLEKEYPFIVRRYGLVEGSGGSGRTYGGLGIERVLEVVHDGGVCEVDISRVESRPWGLFGGESGQRSWVTVNGVEDNTHVKRMNRGDLIGVYTSGGGGFGPVAERDSHRRTRDGAEGRLGNTEPGA